MLGEVISLILNNETINQLQRSFRAISMDALNNTEPRWNKIAMLVPSTGAGNDYGWLNGIPGMVEWLGERQVQNISASTYAIKNRSFELTVAVKRDDIEDDSLGLYSNMFQQLGYAVAYSPDEIVFELLKNSFVERGFDGKPFFAPNHRVASKNVSNVSDKTLTRQELRSAIAQMQSLTNDVGRPLRVFQIDGGMRKPLLVIGPSQRSLALEIVGVSTLPNGGANPDYNSVEILVIPELVGDAANYWFMLDVSMPLKPFILQRRKEPQFVAKADPKDENVFARREYVYGFEDRKAAGLGLWQLAFGSTGTTAGA